MKVQRNVGPKFGSIGKRAVLIGYTPSGFILLRPEEVQFYESRDVRFNEKLVYDDKYHKQSIKNWNFPSDKINKEKWFVEFERETSEKLSEISKPEGEIRRKRGRPRKNPKDSEETPLEIPKSDANKTMNEEQNERKTNDT